jgi:uncharacterized protein YggU (UPF0235/DUF167 family)
LPVTGQTNGTSNSSGPAFRKMKINAFIKTRSKTPGVIAQEDGSYLIMVHAPAKYGEANTEIIGRLADYFAVGKGSIRIISGLKSKRKVINID